MDLWTKVWSPLRGEIGTGKSPPFRWSESPLPRRTFLEPKVNKGSSRDARLAMITAAEPSSTVGSRRAAVRQLTDSTQRSRSIRSEAVRPQGRTPRSSPLRSSRSCPTADDHLWPLAAGIL